MLPEVDRFSLPKSIAPPESVIEPLASVRFPTVEPVPKVAAPELNVPVVDIFSFPKEIAPPESVILPEDIVTVPSIVATSVTVKSSVVVNCSAETIPDAVIFPVTVCAPLANAPVVETFSSPKEIEPPESVIDPFAKVKFPAVVPVGSVAAWAKVTPPPFAIVIASSPSVYSINGVWTEVEANCV